MNNAKLIFVFVIILVTSLVNISALFAYDVKAHERITQNALAKSIVGSTGYLRQKLGITLDTEATNVGLRKWLELGSNWEDNDPIGGNVRMRWLNHFYDPTTEKGLNTGGIVIWGDPSVQWGENNLLNGWDWKDARDYYYSALTSVARNTRERAFANTFRALGQVIHLLQDKTVPAHTRNDAHNIPFMDSQRDMYEIYTDGKVNSLAYAGYPVADNTTFDNFDKFWKNNGKGLAEYTNRNFLSRNTNIDDNAYALPAATGSWTATETVTDIDSGSMINVEVKYLKGYASDSYRPGLSATVSRLSAYSYYDYEMGRYNNTERVYSLNNSVHKEYSDLLIPRAVGYSAGLLDYFFRGDIEITLPDSGLYSVSNNAAVGFTQIKLRARNISANNEQMTGGTIKLVVGYRRAIDDPFKNYPVDYAFRADDEITHVVVSEKNGVSAIPSDGSVELSFDLSGTPIPVNAINVFVRLVYQGWLGSEDSAVVVGYKDISEPTPADLFNDMDQICLNGKMYWAGSSEAVALADTNNDGTQDWDVYPHGLSNIFYKASGRNSPQNASDSNADVAVPLLNAGYHIRALYFMTDYDFSYNTYQTLLKTMEADPCYHASWITQLYDGMAIKNQVEYEENPDICAPLSAPCSIWWYPTFLEYRGTNLWWGSGMLYTNKAYPDGSECDCYQGVLRNCMSGTQTLKATDRIRRSKLVKQTSMGSAAFSNHLQMQSLEHKWRRIPYELQ